MKRSVIFFLCFIIGTALFAQTGKAYYVFIQTLNLRSKPSSESEVLAKLNMYDNVTSLEDLSPHAWIKVAFNGFEGYVFTDYIKKGKCIVSNYEIRVGAICRDGSRSNAIGRGACSHHGGVAQWLTKTEKSVSVVDD